MKDYNALKRIDESVKKRREFEDSLRKKITDYHNCRSIVDCHACSASENISGDVTWCWFLNAVRSNIEENLEALLNHIF